MDPQRETRARELFVRAMSLPVEARSAFLEDACGADRQLLARVKGLLDLAGEVDSAFLEPPELGEGPRPEAANSIGGYRILREIGRGGMAVVYLAEDDSLRRRVALKVLVDTVSTHPAMVERFHREARAAAKLQHPGIVSIYAEGTDKNYHWFAMEYVSGRDLAAEIELLRRDSNDAQTILPKHTESSGYVAAVLRIVGQVADALHHAHEQGIVHRDVKPKNLLLHSATRVRVVDFGLARDESMHGLTRSHHVLGTPAYMSPEQAAAHRHPIDRRSDVFSLGTVLYELITLSRPFCGTTMDEIVHAVMSAEPTRLRSAAPHVSRDLETVCHRALEKNPADRYQTAAHFAGDLKCVLEGNPILARSPGLFRLMGKRCRKHRVATLSVIAIGLAVAVAVLLWIQAIERLRETIGVAFTADVPAKVWMQRIDRNTARLLAAVEVGETPFADRLDPGQYRFTFTGARRLFAELDVFLDKKGTTVAREVILRSDSDARYRDMVLVQGDRYVFGLAEGSGLFAKRAVDLPAFRLDRTEVSNDEYRQFALATGTQLPAYFATLSVQPGFDQRPVVGISWADATAYAQWVGKRLPTMFEWECAMRAPDARVLPWRPEQAPEPSDVTLVDQARLSSGNAAWAIREYFKHTVAVDDASDSTPLGFRHAAGNVQEFTSTVLFHRSKSVVVKGAAWIHPPAIFPLPHNWSVPIDTRSRKVGFRCASSVVR